MRKTPLTECSVCDFEYSPIVRNHCPICGTSAVRINGRYFNVVNGLEIVRAD